MATKRKAVAPAVELRALDTGTINYVPLDLLHVSPHNVRKVEINDLAGLRASILEHGLLQPLVGYHKDELTYVAAGQRRLLAMQGAMRDGELAAETDVPVRIVDEVQAIEISLAENLERKAMNPADEVRAFKALVDTGHHDATTIAKRFGYDLKLVRRRLKMAVLHEDILMALQNAEIMVDSAEAYAATDDQALQLKIFKAQCKSNWQPHKPSTILIEIRDTGIRADGPLGKFIGGRKAYERAGGTVGIDDAFMPLFECVASGAAMEEVRLTDRTIIETLTNTAIANASKKAEKAALEVYPFIDGIEWIDLVGSRSYDRKVALPKKSDCVFVKSDWSRKTSETTKLAKKAKEKQGARVCAVIDIDDQGKPGVVEGAFVVGKAGWDAVQPKEKARESSQPQTPEERAAAERKRRIENIALNHFGRSLIGDTPGFGVTRVSIDGYGADPKRLNITLTMLDLDKCQEMIETKGYYPEIKDELLAPFRADAEAKLDQIIAEEEAAKTAAAEAEAQRKEAADALLEELETTALVDWPARVVIDTDGYGEITIDHVRTDAGDDMLEVNSPDGECWQSNNVLETLGTIRDCLVESSYTVSREEGPIATVETDEAHQVGEDCAIPEELETTAECEPAE